MSRPSKINQQIIYRLEEAFALDCTDEEACLYADIACSTLYKYQEVNTEFMERKRLLKNRPVLDARKAVIESFRSHPALAFKYLERKRKDEFISTVETKFSSDSMPLPILGGISTQENE